jgi:hypothetical protein
MHVRARKAESPDGIHLIILSRRFAYVFCYIFASSNKAKIIMRSPGTHNPKRNNLCVRPAQPRPREENFSLAILAEADSPYIRVTNQVEDMLKSRRK